MIAEAIFNSLLIYGVAVYLKPVYDQEDWLLYDVQPAFFSKKIDTHFWPVYGYTGI
mgnify:CR=1 FL=1